MNELQCEFKNQSCVERIKYVGKSAEEPITIPSNIVGIKGNHEEGKSNKDVENFYFRNTEVYFLPRGLGGIFISLTILEVSNCGLKAISRQDLIGFSLLQDLCLKQNDLKSLPDDLLTGMRRLKFVNFESNLLERLSSKLLEPIKDQLLFAAFYGNPFINENFVKSQGQDLKAFMKLLDENHLPPIVASSTPNKKEELYEKGLFHDCTLVLGDKNFKVHKIILAAQSPYFERFFSEAPENNQALMIHKYNAASFDDFLRFFYNGSRIRKGSNAVELLQIAHQFEFANLKSVCEENILRKLDESSFIAVYNLGHRYESEKLKQAAFKVIQKLFPGTSDDCIDQVNEMNALIATKRRLEDLVQSAKRFKKVS